MTTDEINKYIFVEIMGGCPHPDIRKCVLRAEDRPSFDRPYEYVCRVCHMSSKLETGYAPDYCSDASPRSLLNEVLAKMCKSEKSGPYFERALAFPVGAAFCDSLDLGGLHDNPNLDNSDAVAFISATAEQIARACVEAHKSQCTTN